MALARVHRVRGGHAVACTGWMAVPAVDEHKAVIVFDVPPGAVRGYDVRRGAALLAHLYYARRYAPKGPLLLVAVGSDRAGIVLDQRWCRWFGAHRSLLAVLG